MQTTAILDQARDALDRLRQYVADHHTVEDLTELNDKYVPAELQDDVRWLIDIFGRLAAADPNAAEIDAPARPGTDD